MSVRKMDYPIMTWWTGLEGINEEMTEEFYFFQWRLWIIGKYPPPLHGEGKGAPP